MKVPFLDLKSQMNSIRDEVNTCLNEVMDKTAFSSGPFVEEFEKSFSKFCDTKYCVAVNSGTSALHLALLSCGIRPGDEVITVPNSFISTAWAISYCSAKPVFVDVDPDTFLMDFNQIEKAITPKTKAIIPVHLYGQPADMKEINDIAKKNNLKVIEDAAQAHSSFYNNKKIGSLGNITCFSFYPGKNLGGYGEGGAIVTNDKSVSEELKMLRNHGQSKRYYHDFIGYNYRMDGFQGAILNVKLKYIEHWTQLRNRIANSYSQKFSKIKQIKIPIIAENNFSAFHLYVIHIDERMKLMSQLEKYEIFTGLHYPVPIHLQKAYKYLGYKEGAFPVSEESALKCLSLPIYPEMSDYQVDFVIETIFKYFKY